jgi:hypothetical protein
MFPMGTSIKWLDYGPQTGLVSGTVGRALMVRVTSQKEPFTCSVHPDDCEIVQDAATFCDRLEADTTTDYLTTCPICLDADRFMGTIRKVRVCKQDWRHLTCKKCSDGLTECPFCRGPLFD